MKPKHVLPTGVIFVCLAMQASVALTGTKVWPFMAYCMYAIPQDAPPRHRQREVFVHWEDGSVEPAQPSMLGVGWYSWERHHLRPMLAGDELVTLGAAGQIDGRDTRRLKQITARITTHTVTDSGITQAERIITLWPFEPDNQANDALSRGCCD